MFNASVSGDYESEALSSGQFLFGSFAADRTTEDWDIAIGLSTSHSRDRFEFEDGGEFTSTSESLDLTGTVVGALADHWSWAAGGSVTRSTFLNQDLTVRFAPGLEYNVFRYDESNRRQLTIAYALGVNRFRYEQPSIFGETTETRLDGTLTVSLDLTQPWGRSGLALEAAQFLDDPGQNRVVAFGDLGLRLFRGVSLEVYGSASRIRDQIFLPAAGLTAEEVLVELRQQRTGFQLSLSVGVSFTVGSIYNNVVNSSFRGAAGGLLRRF